MSDKTERRRAEDEDMMLRLATARSTDTAGEAVLPVTANVTAGEQVIEPEEERNSDFTAGS